MASGGARVPDGKQRPASPALVKGPNRTDLAELPGTPGTPLPPNPAEPQVQHGQAGRLKEMLGGIPLEQVSPQVGLTDPSQRPNEPVTAGVNMGAGPGAAGLMPSPDQLTERLTANQLRSAYPLIMRLATLPNATMETKILAQRIRANLSISPEQMPAIGSTNGSPGQPN